MSPLTYTETLNLEMAAEEYAKAAVAAEAQGDDRALRYKAICWRNFTRLLEGHCPARKEDKS